MLMNISCQTVTQQLSNHSAGQAFSLIKDPISAATPTQSSNNIFQAREMFRRVLFLILWGSAVAITDLGLDRHWVLWKKIHSKVYSHEVEEPGYTYFRMFSTV